MNTGLSWIDIAAKPTFHDYFSGVIDEVFIFNRPLSPEELDYMRGFGVSIRFNDGFETGDTSRWSTTAP